MKMHKKTTHEGLSFVVVVVFIFDASTGNRS